MQRHQLAAVGDAVVVPVLPEAQAREDGISRVYRPVAVAAVLRLVVFGERAETVVRLSLRRRGLGREAAEQLRAVLDRNSNGAVEDEPRVVRVRSSPRDVLDNTARLEVETNPAGRVRESNPSPAVSITTGEK